MRDALPTNTPETPTTHLTGCWRRAGRGLLVAALAAGVIAGGTVPAHAAVTTSTTSGTVSASVADRFGRTLTSGWGAAEQGGTWSATSGTSGGHSVGYGAGRQRVSGPGHTSTALLSGYSSTSTDLRLAVALDKAASGGGTYVSIIGRRVGTAGDYRARLKVQENGVVTLSASRGETSLQSVTVPGLTYTAGTKVSVRLQVTGTSPTTVRAKAWKAGTAEPSGWQVSGTDSTTTLQQPGGVGTSTYVSGTAAKTSVTASYTDLAAGPVVTNAAPTARLSSSTSGLAAVLDGSASSDPDGTITKHSWTFGDGSTGTGATAQHSYAAAGTYTVRLTVTDDKGATSTTSSTVTATRPNVPPVAALSTSTSDLTVSVDGTGSSDADGRVASYTWSFGDGSTGTGVTAKHTYAAAGTYTVGLTVTDDNGATSTRTAAVSVTAPPVVAATTATSSPAVPAGSVQPGPTNTGVPTGTKLTVHNGDLVVSTPGAVIDAMDIRGLVVVKAANVTIKRSIIRGRPVTSNTSLISNSRGAYPFTLEDSELAATHPSPYINGIIGANFTVKRANIHGVIDQIHLTGGNVTVESSWLHDNLHFTVDPNHKDGSHDDSIQVQGGRNITITGNTISGAYNAAIQFTQDISLVSDVRVTKNWLNGGGCTINVAEKGKGPLQNLTITDNTFGRDTRHTSCAIISPVTTVIDAQRNLYTDGQTATVRKG